jgi:menaquinone-dependent protoporphyrinogen IX oxidase
MEEDKIITRREGLKSALLLGIALNIGVGADRANAQAASGSGSVLVAYFTRTGNTQVIARQIRRALDADLFEIQPAELYPEDYEETVAQATRERESGFEPPLAALVANIDRYETVFLGFPIWGMSAPSVIRSFLSGHDSRGRRSSRSSPMAAMGSARASASLPSIRRRRGFSKVFPWRPTRSGGRSSRSQAGSVE